MNYETKLIKISNLKINSENPRFETVENQREAITSIIENQKEKLIRLGDDIIEHGLNPADLIIVTPDLNDKNTFIVLEGNRRITTLKILNNPNLVSATTMNGLLNRFKKLSDKFNENPIFNAQCVVFENEMEAMKWIRLKHTGENEGVGTVTWDAQQKARFEEKINGKSSYALQIIEHLKNDVSFDENLKSELAKMPSSNLQRLLTDPNVRKTIGLDIKSGKIVTSYSADEIRKPLTRIVRDLTNPEFTVKQIYYKEDRDKYIETFDNLDIPIKDNSIGEWEIDGKNYKKSISSSSTTIEEAPATKKVTNVPLSTNRKTLIPTSCIIKIKIQRVNKIYRELKSINVDEYENAVSVLFRVFIELSVDSFVESKSLDCTSNDKLALKVGKVVEYLTNNTNITSQQLSPVNTSLSNKNSYLSMVTFNQYVHNKHAIPSPKELKISWDGLEPFLVKLWETI
ncbi:hypothetical protein [Flavobacterium defluvii]|uniref:ParB-like nuclease domain-containing protein n=1 Tax=Flavobacterium defluvii TaxID=370979 RepID=A0A1M5J249_9FLAO|nr:hypothetical protein [Flavobacterium defluvii]SHG34602.1 hypothetical protein SAMN05443663_102585 [Flavobacterium defluvii]